MVYLTTTPCASSTGVLPLGYAGVNATVVSPTLTAQGVAPTVTSVDISTASGSTAGDATGSVTADAVTPVSTGAAGRLEVVGGVLGAAFAFWLL